jgi:PRTRC genetic system protein C
MNDKEKKNDHSQSVTASPRVLLQRQPHPRSQPVLSVDQVRDFLTPMYPEIATASVTGPEDAGTATRYTFARAIGSKG